MSSTHRHGPLAAARRRMVPLLVLGLALAAPLTAQDAASTESAPPRVIGRAAPNWSDAVRLRTDQPPTPLDPRTTDTLRGSPVLLLAARTGEALPVDLETAASFLPKFVDAGGRRRIHLLVDSPDPGIDLPADGPGRFVHAPEIDAAYGAPARPWVAVHDRRGLVVDVLPLSSTGPIQEALQRASPGPRVHALVGQAMEPVTALEPRELPADAEGAPRLDLLRAPTGGLVLYRFWTDGCPHCRASVPALTALAERFEGFRLVPVYHRKSRIQRSEEWLHDYLGDLDFAGPWAEDPEWTTLRKLMRRGNLNTATSVSFLVDEHGVIRWVHRGPRVHPDPDDAHGPAGQDYSELEGLVTRWVGPLEPAEDGR